MMVKKNKGMTLITLVVTIVVLIILAGVTIGLTLGADGLIQRAKDTKRNIILSKEEMETNLNELNSDTDGNDEFTTENAELLAFKLAISDAIYEGSNNKLQISDHKTALTTEFTDSIKQIVTEVTKDATATAADIASGKTAYVNGTKITGTARGTIDIQKTTGSVTISTTNTSSQKTITANIGVGKTIVGFFITSTSGSSNAMYNPAVYATAGSYDKTTGKYTGYITSSSAGTETLKNTINYVIVYY